MSAAPTLADLLTRFSDLLARARAMQDPEPTATTLATATAEGRLSARTVLLKEVDARGFVFFTNYDSIKGQQLEAHPRAALSFLWKTLDLGVQVQIEGSVEKVSAAESDAYFATRPRLSQIGAWASQQSATLAERGQLLARLQSFEEQYAGQTVPRPPQWGGFRVLPDMIEFWHAEEFRLHKRERHELVDGQWHTRLLFP